MICALDFEAAARTAFVRGYNTAAGPPGYRSAILIAKRDSSVAAHSTALRTSLIGIDLGTSNSTIACLQDGGAVIVPAADGGRFTPSVVALSKVRPSSQTSLIEYRRRLLYAEAEAPSTNISLENAEHPQVNLAGGLRAPGGPRGCRGDLLIRQL